MEFLQENVWEWKPVEIHCKPVSYTHLDVYKRQQLDCGKCLFKILGEGISLVEPTVYTNIIVMSRN